jgi:hypothetical protein
METEAQIIRRLERAYRKFHQAPARPEQKLPDAPY